MIVLVSYLYNIILIPILCIDIDSDEIDSGDIGGLRKDPQRKDIPAAKDLDKEEARRKEEAKKIEDAKKKDEDKKKDKKKREGSKTKEPAEGKPNFSNPI